MLEAQLEHASTGVPAGVEASTDHGDLERPDVETPAAVGAVHDRGVRPTLFEDDVRAVLPKETLLLPVGGVSEENMAQFWAAGANGFGIGSSLYKPGSTAAEVSARAVTPAKQVQRVPSARGTSELDPATRLHVASLGNFSV